MLQWRLELTEENYVMAYDYINTFLILNNVCKTGFWLVSLIVIHYFDPLKPRQF